MKNSIKNRIKNLTTAAIISTIYIVMTLATATLNLASGIIQVRLSECLCVLPIFTIAAIPGLFLGCLLSNLIIGAPILDIIFGSIATLIGAIFTYHLRKHRIISLLSPIISNSLIIPYVLIYGYSFKFVLNGLDLSYLYFIFTIFIGEFISVFILGQIIISIISKIYKNCF